MPPIIIQFQNRTYKTQKEFEAYIKDLIYSKIGICRSVKKERHAYYETLNEFLSRHPEFNEKTKHLTDYAIDQCPLAPIKRKTYRVFIINSDGTQTDISWRCALTGRGKTPKHELYSALRVAVQQSVIDYRKNNELICSICNRRKETMHVDHIKQFDEIVMEFISLMKEKSINIPRIFDELNDGTCRRTFMESDIQFKNDWYDYHEKNASYRILCQECNLTRKKGKRSHYHPDLFK